MKRLLVVCMLAIAAALGGCTTTTDPNGNVVITDVNSIISQVQAYCRLACGFVPTATTVANILSGGNPAVAVVSSISAAICAAVVPPKAGSRRAAVARNVKGFLVTPGYVNGVRIEGQRS